MLLFHMLKKIVTNDNKIEDVNGLKLTRKQIKVLNDYKISINVKDIKELLKRINDEMLYHVDSKGLPADEFYNELDMLYWQIDKQNKRH